MKAVVFDMDGVLFDTESVGFAAWDYACKKLGVAPASALAYRTLGMNALAVDIGKSSRFHSINGAVHRKQPRGT